MSGCMNACGHHHVGNIGILGVDKGGEEWYQITIGGAAGADAVARARSSALRCAKADVAETHRAPAGRVRRAAACRRSASSTPCAASASSRSRRGCMPRRLLRDGRVVADDWRTSSDADAGATASGVDRDASTEWLAERGRVARAPRPARRGARPGRTRSSGWSPISRGSIWSARAVPGLQRRPRLHPGPAAARALAVRGRTARRRARSAATSCSFSRAAASTASSCRTSEIDGAAAGACDLLGGVPAGSNDARPRDRRCAHRVGRTRWR